MLAPSVKEYTALFPFCGLGGGALGFLRAGARLFGREVRFRSIGGIDNDPASCADFEYLTESPALCADISRLTPAELRAFAGPVAPDLVFTSAPCKSYSGLMGKAKRIEPAYVDMSRLGLECIKLILSTWDVPPRMFLFENVPRIATLGKAMLAEIVVLLRASGYAVKQGNHNCGKLSGGPQNRNRFLMVARHLGNVMARLEVPPEKRVCGVGEVIGKLGLPEDPRHGRMHRLSRIGWLTWVRLALIPAGGDHRDLEGSLAVLAEGQPRREVHRRNHVEAWENPSVTIAGPGTNGACAVADPRVELGIDHQNPKVRGGGYFPGVMGVVGWNEPSGTVTGNLRPGTGAGSVADLRINLAYDHCYGVVPYEAPSFTVAGVTHPGCGAYTVADERVQAAAQALGCDPRSGAYGVIGWEDAARTITGHPCIDNGPFAIADRRVPSAQPIAIVRDFKKSPFVLGSKGEEHKVPVVIVAKDGSRGPRWHRPFTPTELALIQDLPATVRGEALDLHGSSMSAILERIGNAVPAGAAEAIARQMLITLAATDYAAGMLPSGGKIWVGPTYPRYGGAEQAPELLQ
jgi:site-specific DNA-cytosine methylase